MILGAVLAAALAVASSSDEAHKYTDAGGPETSDPAAAPPRTSITVPAGLPILVALAEPMSSKTAKAGAGFRISLATPIVVGGEVAVPAGATGEGEVIDAAPGGAAGKPGKLVLAARYLDVGGRRLPLRAFRLAGAGAEDTTSMLVASAVVGPAVFFVNGHDVVYPAGTRAVAKIAAETELPVATAQSSQPAQGGNTP